MCPCQASMLLLWTLAVLSRADPLCDPDTQYLHNGECCQKCKPGTSMVSIGMCRTPACKDCEENEYMDSYNTEQICESQPYCDPNSNFKWPESTSKTERHQCQCKEGFHCSSASCFTCVPHTQCGPGFGAVVIGDQTQDTKCEKCPDGKYSDEKSWNGACKEREATPAPEGPTTAGTGEKGNQHVGLIVLGVVVAITAVVVGVVLYIKRKGKTGHTPIIMPADSNGDLYKVAIGDEEKRSPLIASPTDDHEELSGPLQESAYSSRPPEENEDVVLTDNGDVLSQDGKEYVMSQPETQAMTVK